MYVSQDSMWWVLGKTFRELNKASGFMAISGFALTLTTRDVWLLGLVRHQWVMAWIRVLDFFAPEIRFLGQDKTRIFPPVLIGTVETRAFGCLQFCLLPDYFSACSGGRIVSWIIYCRLVWCERKTRFPAGNLRSFTSKRIGCWYWIIGGEANIVTSEILHIVKDNHDLFTSRYSWST